jgi:hypothetical protein
VIIIHLSGSGSGRRGVEVELGSGEWVMGMGIMAGLSMLISSLMLSLLSKLSEEWVRVVRHY